jgi:hypothetical protein
MMDRRGNGIQSRKVKRDPIEDSVVDHMSFFWSTVSVSRAGRKVRSLRVHFGQDLSIYNTNKKISANCKA